MLLQAANVHKQYRQSETILHVLKGVELSVETGEVLAIVGPSGAGKSTLLHILGGLDKPTEGQVTLEGRELYSLSDRERSLMRNQKIGFVFQFYHLLPEFTALENVILPTLVKKNLDSLESLQVKGRDLLGSVGLIDRAEHKPHQLSGGEQQRVAIARALINDPPLILCDEPTGNLDSVTGAEIINLLMDLNERSHPAFVIVTHDEEIARRARRKIYMRDGKLI